MEFKTIYEYINTLYKSNVCIVNIRERLYGTYAEVLSIAVSIIAAA